MNTIPSQYTLDNEFINLLAVYEKSALQVPSPVKSETIKVNFVVSAAASIYETIRNVIEYREEHLLRRAAIERILKRLIYLQNSAKESAGILIRELIWARYLPNNIIPESKVTEIAKLINSYLELWKAFNKNHLGSGKRKNFEFILELASCDIEENLTSPQKREALFNFAYHILTPNVQFEATPFTAIEAKLIFRTALRKALLKSDDQLLAFDLFKQFFPEWFSQHQNHNSVISDLHLARKKIAEIIENSKTEILFHYCRQNIAPFLILQDALEKNPDKVREKLKSSSLLGQMIRKITEEKYTKIKKKLTMATTRSILYIFLTKMLLAFIIEFPYERFIVKQMNYMAIIINVIVPPAIMFLITLSITVPGEKNTLAIIEYIKGIVYKEVPDQIIPFKERDKLNKNKQILFGFFYTFGFLITFGIIIYFLDALHFNLIGGVIFLMFLTLVSFFGFMIRQQVKDIALGNITQTGLNPVLDFFAFPIIRTGYLISGTFKQLNIAIYVFDLFLEAPFKTIIQLFEEWFSFVRERKDEIL